MDILGITGPGGVSVGVCLIGLVGFLLVGLVASRAWDDAVERGARMLDEAIWGGGDGKE